MRSLLVLILFLAASATGAEELKTLAGKTVIGTLKQIDDKTIVIATADGSVETPLSQALLLDLRPRGVPADEKYLEVRLLDDSYLLAKAITYSTKEVELTLLSGTTLKVPLVAVVSVLKDAQNGAIHRQFRA